MSQCCILFPHAERFNLHFLKSFSDRQKKNEQDYKGVCRLEVQHQRYFEERNIYEFTFEVRNYNFLNCGRLKVSFML